jgi:phospholipid/cholesterol/gamma-HCH transport system ATP-binding protein
MEPILTLRNIKKSFDDKIIHQGVAFDLYPSETLGLLGNSGTGKSVLLRSIIGLEYIDEGEIYFKNNRIDLLSERNMYPIRTKISYAFQNGALFDSVNVFENLAYPLFEHTKLDESSIYKKVMDALKVVNMEHAASLMPSDLSGGMQKRVGLARSMILNPDIILYDEPTAGLDPVNVENVLDIMAEVKSRGISGIFVTHDIPAAKKICDRLIILDNGIVAFNGNVKEFEESKSKIVKRFINPQEVLHES